MVATDGYILSTQGTKARTKDSSPSLPPPRSLQMSAVCYLIRSGSQAPKPPPRPAVSRCESEGDPRPAPAAGTKHRGGGAERGGFITAPAMSTNKAMGPGIPSSQQHFYANEISELDPAACGKLE